jgi:FkbM family methyltransferase
LPYGGWFLAYGDAMGARIAGYSLARTPYEEGQWRFVSRFLRPGMVFGDVGANQGFYTIVASQRVGAAGRVFAFEPAVSERRKLRRNLRLNRCHNVRVEATALGEYDGMTEFYLCLQEQGSFSSRRPQAEDVTAPRRRMVVPLVRLDTYAQRRGLEALDLLKIDVEGGELAVLAGAEETISRFQPLVICEVEDRRALQWGQRGRQIVDFLLDREYNWYTVRSDGTLVPHIPTSTYLWHNLLAVPRSRTDSVAPFVASDGDTAC